MKRVLAATALIVFGFAPAMVFACEYMDESSASAAPSTQLASTPAPAASKVPARTSTQVLATKAAKPDKAKSLTTDRKVAAVTSN